MYNLIGWDNPGIAGVVPGYAQYKKARLDRMGLFADGFKELKKASEQLYKTPKSIQETMEYLRSVKISIPSATAFRILTTPLPQKMNRLAFSKDTASS